MLGFMHGALVMACVVAALRFRHYWKLSGDRLFSFFSWAFVMFAVNWGLLAVLMPSNEALPYYYLPRLAAFGCIIVGIIDKNMRSKRTEG